ncbi:uncharacterized protein ATC70_012150 [Mucor velutinosus]|uniref:Chromatin modification-related protein EAF7 n=1 Tax=Mucor velutinosus TaxID=708070 RepID=A0AAN7DRM1_9FUNG|nr:hypothetical protein ATC70_012150 [Mucor velutinosus]
MDTVNDTESPYTSSHLDDIVKVEHTMMDDTHFGDKEWDAGMELALLNAISRCKPVGIHKHFRIISVQRQFNQNSPVACSIKEIWQRLGDFYGMAALDELEEEDEEQEEEEREEEEKKKGDVKNEFSLPLDDYEQLISEHRQDDQSISSIREESDATSSPVLPPTKRTRISKRDSSPANSVTDSITSNNNTPEPEEGKPSRKSSRSNPKSTPEPASRSGGRRAGRSSSTASNASTNNRGNKRQTKRK